MANDIESKSILSEQNGAGLAEAKGLSVDEVSIVSVADFVDWAETQAREISVALSSSGPDNSPEALSQKAKNIANHLDWLVKFLKEIDNGRETRPLATMTVSAPKVPPVKTHNAPPACPPPTRRLNRP